MAEATTTAYAPGRPPAAKKTLGALVALALLASAAFLTVGVRGSWAFVLERRTTTLATMIVVAAAVGLATVLFHTATANRILTPAVMGMDALYVLLQTVLALAVGVAWSRELPPLTTFVLETVVMVAVCIPLMRWLLLGQRRGVELVVLTGLVAGGVFRSVAAFLQRVMDPGVFTVLQDRLFADFTAAEPPLVALCAVLVLLALAWAWRTRHELDVLALGPGLATSLGVDHRRRTMHVLVVTVVLVSVSTALVGPTTFFGLLVAHLAYRVTSTHRHALTVPAAAVIAIVTLVAGQVVFERVLGYEGSLSIVVELLGGLTFLALCLRRAPR